jgi:hypothetical protein
VRRTLKRDRFTMKPLVNQNILTFLILLVAKLNFRHQSEPNINLWHALCHLKKGLYYLEEFAQEEAGAGSKVEGEGMKDLANPQKESCHVAPV